MWRPGATPAGWTSRRWPALPNPAFLLEPVAAIDAPRLEEFAAAVWGEEGRTEFAAKWWRATNFASTLAAIDPANDRMAALCVGVPSHWRLPDGSQVEAISICGWYVHPDYAGQGLGQWLVRSFKDASGFNALSISETAIRGFAKLGWVGPYRSFLRLLPLPRLRHPFGQRLPLGWRLSVFEASARHFPEALATALDRIDDDCPPKQLRRRRRAADWRAHLSARPTRRPRFHILEEPAGPMGYGILRETDTETGRVYRTLRLHFVSDFVCNRDDPATIDLLLASLAAAAPVSAGALLLCTSLAAIAERAARAGWLHETSPLIGSRLADKAPRYMVGGEFVRFADQQWQLTFADSDVDLNI